VEVKKKGVLWKHSVFKDCEFPRVLEETMEVLDTKELSQKENKELFVKKCMSLTMECIKAHIFVAVDYQEPVIRQSHKAQSTEGGMLLCSQ